MARLGVVVLVVVLACSADAFAGDKGREKRERRERDFMNEPRFQFEYQAPLTFDERLFGRPKPKKLDLMMGSVLRAGCRQLGGRYSVLEPLRPIHDVECGVSPESWSDLRAVFRVQPRDTSVGMLFGLRVSREWSSSSKRSVGHRFANVDVTLGFNGKGGVFSLGLGHEVPVLRYLELFVNSTYEGKDRGYVEVTLRVAGWVQLPSIRFYLNQPRDDLARQAFRQYGP